MPRPTNALLVDDEPHVRAFMRLLLKEVGITKCTEAGDGLMALELAQKESPDLMLLDINLPRMGGLEVLAKVKELELDIAVVLVTSQSAAATVNEAVRLGASGYILKHAAKEDAIEALRDVIESLDDENAEGE